MLQFSQWFVNPINIKEKAENGNSYNHPKYKLDFSLNSVIYYIDSNAVYKSLNFPSILSDSHNHVKIRILMIL